MWLISNYIYVNFLNSQEGQTECAVESKKGDEESAQSSCGAKRRFGATSRVQVDDGVIKGLPKPPVNGKRSAPQKKTDKKKTDSTHQREKNGLC